MTPSSPLTRRVFTGFNAMLAGVPFEFLVDLTDLLEHEKINRRGMEAG